jgi:hypothetical protein
MDQDVSAIHDDSSVIELRQYTLHPGRRDTLIDLFERAFIESQEAVGIRVLGQFRDTSHPDRFVWLRGFRDMPSRAEALQAFYGGPVWQAHRGRANATMVDSDDVLLLRPVDARASFVLPRTQPAPGATPRTASLVVAIIYLLTATVDDDFVRFFEDRVAPVMVATGAPPIARFRTEYADNNFPALPVRTGEHAFVWFAAFATTADFGDHVASLARSEAWSAVVEPALTTRLASPPRQLRLEPTARSRLGRSRPDSPATERTGDVHDFDFIAGDWNIRNRRLKARGVGSDDWDEFPATSRGALHLGGVANVDEITFPTQGWSGMTVRVFDRARRRWSLHWMNSRTGVVFPPVVGGFEGHVGEFYGEDEDDGRPVKIRFVWTRLGPDAARWEQAFSADGRAWETNWVMELTRRVP